ncbi:hypothetical protein RTCIAT899_CH11260 [Rhizobium tropici CIAT 899]|nr:hypothetical protein RTCIAT899_CH11260 [Rhizobium tropici CIAT 899]
MASPQATLAIEKRDRLERLGQHQHPVLWRQRSLASGGRHALLG